MQAPARIATFVLVSAALIAFAMALAPADPSPPSLRAVRPTATIPGEELIVFARQRRSRLEVAASAFIGLFLHYEVGDLTPPLARSLRRSSTAGFGRYLLGARPRQNGAPGIARIVKLESAFLDRAAESALVHAVAERPDGPEEFSFVFVLRGGRWVAARAAE